MKMKQILIIAVLVMMSLTLVAEKPFTAFRLENEKGETFQLADFTGKGLIVVDFWASYCDPCKKALPHMEELHLADNNVEVIAINIDTPRLKRKAMAYIKSQKFTFPTLYDSDGKVADKMRVTEIPYTFLLDNEGKILFEFSSGKADAHEVLQTEIARALKPKVQEKDTE
ncbi:TlpA family protein disulfide reductase [bacterium]|nr:TlpA family protein disulfide reductase [bacterium]